MDLRRRARRWLRVAARVGVIAPLVIFMPLVRLLPWRIVWVVNSGSETDTRAYGFLAKFGELLHIDVGPIGVFRVPKIGWSVIGASNFSNEELRASADNCQRVVRAVQKFRGERIALAGVMPACLSHHDMWPDDDRFVRGQYATVHMVRCNVEDAHKLHPELRDHDIAVVGVGATGRLVANDLAASGYRVRALDVRPETATGLDPNIRFIGTDATQLDGVGVVVLLSTGGDAGVASIGSALVPGTVVVSDTHPKLSRRMARELDAKGVTVYESALTRRGTRIVPKLPGFPNDTIPGCVAQAIVECYLERPMIEQQAFTIVGDRLFEPRLDRPEGLDVDIDLTQQPEERMNI